MVCDFVVVFEGIPRTSLFWVFLGLRGWCIRWRTRGLWWVMFGTVVVVMVVVGVVVAMRLMDLTRIEGTIAATVEEVGITSSEWAVEHG